MKNIGERITVKEGKNKSTVVIQPEKKAHITALIGAWVAMWWMIGAIMTWAYFKLDLSQQEGLIVVIFMVFWAYYAYRVTKQFFWILWGMEFLKVDKQALTIKRSTRGYGKANAYYLENINDFQWKLPKERSIQASWEATPWISGGQRMQFEYFGKMVRFGEKLNDKDANRLFHFLTSEMERQLKEKRREEKAQTKV